MDDKKGRSQDPMTIRVGSGWTRFAYEKAGVELLGVVVHGLEIGALGKLPDGSYVQVNGDVVRTLDASRVELALRRTGLAPPDTHAVHAGPAKGERPLPTIIVKKRRLTYSTEEVTSIGTGTKAPNISRLRLTLKKVGAPTSSAPGSADARPSSDD